MRRSPRREVTAFRALERNTLRGFATIAHDNGIVVLDCALHERDGKRWCSPPSRPMLDRDRRLVVGDDGKVKYVPTIDLLVDTKTRSRWSTAAVQAIDAWLADDSKAPAEAGAMSGGTSDGGEPPGVR